MNNNLALFLTHHIFLTDKQIKKLFDKQNISILGYSVPVWVNAKTSETTEPAMEFFCQYEIDISNKNDIELVNKKGYKINLINKIDKKLKSVNFESLSVMTSKERGEFEKKRDKQLKQNFQMNLENLLKTGYFRIEIKKINQTFDNLKNCIVDIQHIIEIKKIEKLIESLT